MKKEKKQSYIRDSIYVIYPTRFVCFRRENVAAPKKILRRCMKRPGDFVVTFEYALYEIMRKFKKMKKKNERKTI